MKAKWMLLGLVALGLSAGEVKLVWDPNPPEDLVQGYVVYEHIGNTYTNVAFVRTNSVVLTNVAAGAHCYVVTASNFWGESLFSNEACTQVVVDPPREVPPLRPGRLTVEAGLQEKDFYLAFPIDTNKLILEQTTDFKEWVPALIIYKRPDVLDPKGIILKLDPRDPKVFWRTIGD